MAFSVALSGLKGASSQLEITGNNIANVGTKGFKKSFADFVDVYSDGGTLSIGKGVRLAAASQIFSQGAVGASEGSLDMAINGEGYFIVKANGLTSYTRAGSFAADNAGYVTTSNGSRLQGYQADSTGAINGSLGDINISTASLPPVSTSTFSAKFNLNAQSTIPTVSWAGTAQFGGTSPSPNTYNNATSTTVYDSLGNAHVLTAYFLKTAVSNVWNAHFQIDGTNVSTSSAKSNSLTSTASNILAVGNLPTIGATDLVINGTTVGAPIGDGVSTTQPASSAKAIATAINAASVPGVTATADTNTFTLGTYTPGTLSGAQLKINGQNVVVGTATTTALLTAINGLTGTTGVTASLDSSSNVVLSAADGRNIQVASLGTATPATFSAFPLTSVADSVKRGTVSLASTAPFVISGDAPTNAGFTANTYLAPWRMKFNPDGSFDSASSDTIALDWSPLDSTGSANGSTTPQRISVDFSTSTQYGTAFAVDTLSQNGSATGRLSSISISNNGTIFGRYSNGNSLSLAQVALASFQSQSGLSPIGNSYWAETSSSGPAVVGTPGTSRLGNLQSSSLEDSNVNLTEELVTLILAQRNFQANVQTITTANTTTQSLLNIR